MNVNRKFDRFKQWAGERMGGEIKTNLSDDFKAMETEMSVRNEGLDRLHKSMIAYVKAVSKRSEGDDKEKTLPIGHLGTSMVSHGEDYDAHSDYGRCLTSTLSLVTLLDLPGIHVSDNSILYCTEFGRTEERIARLQESYIAEANSSWLESLDRSLAQMKQYQNARRKLDSRRLAFDTSLSKMQKAKKEDFRAEEELRTQKAKYEEANDDVYRRMQDIKEGEVESIADLEAFLEAQLNYHEKCREVLLQLKNDWPSRQSQTQSSSGRRPGRARASTAHSYQERYEPLHEELSNSADLRPIIRTSRSPSDVGDSREVYVPEPVPQRPFLGRTSTFESPAQLRQEQTYSSSPRPSRAPSENFITGRNSVLARMAADPSEDASPRSGTSPDRLYQGRSDSPVSPFGGVTRRSSSTTLNGAAIQKKAPPPPPPSRAKKPPPPPPPMKKPILNAGEA
ncbi:BAR domain protein [Aspergillus flavus]|nr:BAR domain protein [Aspergillus flavus]